MSFLTSIPQDSLLLIVDLLQPEDSLHLIQVCVYIECTESSDVRAGDPTDILMHRKDMQVSLFLDYH
jgi:hypothetical protein